MTGDEQNGMGSTGESAPVESQPTGAAVATGAAVPAVDAPSESGAGFSDDDESSEAVAAAVVIAAKAKNKEVREARGEEPAADDEPGPGDEEDPADYGDPDPDPVGETGEGSDGPVNTEFGTEDEFDDYLDRAARAGLPRHTVVGAFESGSMRAVVEAAEAAIASLRPTADELPSFELPEFDVPSELVSEYGETLPAGVRKLITQSFTGVPEYLRKVVAAELAPIQSQLDRYRQIERMRAADEIDRKTEKFFVDNREKFADKFGGPTHELEAGDPKFRSRAEVVNDAEALAAGYRSKGRPVPAWEQLLAKAAAMHSESVGSPAPTRSAKANGRTVARPNASSNQTTRSKREIGIDKVAAMMRARGYTD